MNAQPPTFPPQAWAHRQGKIAMHPLGPSDWSPEALSARMQIAEAFHRWGTGHDEARADVTASCFTPDGVLEVGHGSIEPITHLAGRAEITQHVEQITARQQDQRRHLMGNILVEDLDVAAGTATALAECIVTVAADGLSVGCTVIYYAELRRDTDECWRFSYFFIGMDTYVGLRS